MLLTVAHVRRDGELPLLSDTHVEETLVPSFDHLPDSHWLSAVSSANDSRVNSKGWFLSRDESNLDPSLASVPV
jgi:hypothetical protein